MLFGNNQNHQLIFGKNLSSKEREINSILLTGRVSDLVALFSDPELSLEEKKKLLNSKSENGYLVLYDVLPKLLLALAKADVINAEQIKDLLVNIKDRDMSSEPGRFSSSQNRPGPTNNPSVLHKFAYPTRDVNNKLLPLLRELKSAEKICEKDVDDILNLNTNRMNKHSLFYGMAGDYKHHKTNFLDLFEQCNKMTPGSIEKRIQETWGLWKKEAEERISDYTKNPHKDRNSLPLELFDFLHTLLNGNQKITQLLEDVSESTSPEVFSQLLEQLQQEKYINNEDIKKLLFDTKGKCRLDAKASHGFFHTPFGSNFLEQISTEKSLLNDVRNKINKHIEKENYLFSKSKNKAADLFHPDKKQKYADHKIKTSELEVVLKNYEQLRNEGFWKDRGAVGSSTIKEWKKLLAEKKKEREEWIKLSELTERANISRTTDSWGSAKAIESGTDYAIHQVAMTARPGR